MLEVTTRKYLPFYKGTITFVKAMTTSADTVLATAITLNGIYQHLPKGQHTYFEKISLDSKGGKSYRMKMCHLKGAPEEIMEVSCDYESNSESRSAHEDVQEKRAGKGTAANPHCSALRASH